jgi:cell division protein FtsB
VSVNRRYQLALAVLVVLLGVMLLGPFKSLTAASDRVAELERRRAELSAEVAALEQRRADLDRPEEIELLARSELGLVEPGEVPFVVVTPEPPPPSAPAPVEDRPWYEQLWDGVTGLFR